MKKKIGFVVVGLWISVQALAQETKTAPTIATMQAAEKIKGEVYSGYSSGVSGDFETVHDAFIKNLKTYGKVKENKHSITVNSPTVSGTTFQEKAIHALVKSSGGQTYLWVGIKAEDWERTSLDLIMSQTDKILKDFVLAYYRGSAQKKIDETQNAWESIEKLQTKTVKQASDLKKKLENNVKEKGRLEQAIVDNAKENVSLQSRIEGNKKAQDSIANVLQQVKKKMATHQEELLKIN